MAEIETLYAAGDYDAAARRLVDLLVHDQGVPTALRAQVYLMKARLELAFGRPGEIRLWLAKAFAANPSLGLDPVRDPPTLIAAWKELRRPAAEVDLPAGAAGSFALGLLPLGLGHVEVGRPRDAALFFTTESLVLLAAATLPTADGSARMRARTLGGATLLGTYGYELDDLLPDLALRDAGAAASVRFGLSFFPFGVGQAKNHEPFKALALAAVDASLLTAATLAADEPQRRAALAGFAAFWAYGMLDGVLHHADLPAAADGSAADGAAGAAFGCVPVRTLSGWGIAATLRWQGGS